LLSSTAYITPYYGLEQNMDCNMDGVYKREEKSWMSVKCVCE